MKTTLAKSLLVLTAITAPSAFADDCDYVGRHYKTDVTITGAGTFPGSRQGDILIASSVRLTVTNVGVYEITDPAPPNSIVHARRVGVNIKGTTLHGYLPMPMPVGASAFVSFSLPDRLVGTCEDITATLITDGTLPQYGCQVRDNDSIAFKATFQNRFCNMTRPFPSESNEDVDNLDNADATEELNN